NLNPTTETCPDSQLCLFAMARDGVRTTERLDSSDVENPIVMLGRRLAIDRVRHPRSVGEPGSYVHVRSSGIMYESNFSCHQEMVENYVGRWEMPPLPEVNRQTERNRERRRRKKRR